MKYLYVLLLLGLYSSSYSQNTYFNKAIGNDTITLLTAPNLPVQDGYLVAGGFSSYNNYRAIYIKKLDFNGNLLWTKIIDDEPVGPISTGTSMIRVQNNYNHFILTYPKPKDDTYEDSDIAVVKFTLNGEILWRRVYGDEDWQVPRAIINTADNGFLVAGFQQPKGGGYPKFYYFKIDSEGNQEWLRTHSRAAGGSDVPYTVLQTQDGGYVLSGFAYSNNTDYDMYIIKTKPNGIIEWKKSYGGDGEDGTARLLPLFPNGYFMSGAIEEDGVEKSYFAKLDDLGNIIWERIHDFNFENIQRTYNFETNPLLTPEGGFIGVMPYMTNDFIIENLLVKLNSRGDTVWTKRLTPDPNNDVYVKDIEMTNDGYIISGFNYTHQPQYGWIIKTDFDGNTCWELGCDSTAIVTNISNIPSQSPYPIQISPNPIRDRATISYNLPLDGLLQVYDLQGKLMENWELKREEEVLDLGLTNWKSGLYLYRVRIEGR
ncbi:MAG: T9SS type A sorting domain-containing protein, partial [Chitinophagales bacterium]